MLLEDDESEFDEIYDLLDKCRSQDFTDPNLEDVENAQDHGQIHTQVGHFMNRLNGGQPRLLSVFIGMANPKPKLLMI